MANCLGLYIENNLIKYAKVSKSNNLIKVESFGVKFYENLTETIKQILQETYSYKIPLSINLSDEVYNKFEVFSLLNKKDMDSLIKTEFENICYDNGNNKNAYEQRYIFANLNNKGEKIKVIHISCPKVNIEQRKNNLSIARINGIFPIGVVIPNLIDINKKSTSIIVNIEKNTVVTKVSNGIVLDINTIPFGAQDILEKINRKENSYSKAYDVCKNTTIYTEEDKDLQFEENSYLEDIMPTLFQIVSEVRKIVEQSFESIEKIYITGTGALINNIDIYFQEYLKNIHCEVLKPKFISNNSKINIKDYIEVNSAISIALQGIEKNNNVNFNKESFTEVILNILKSDVTKGSIKNNTSTINNFLEKYDRQYNIAFNTLISLFVVYILGMCIINNTLNKKIIKANQAIENTNNKIANVKNYNTRFNNQITSYEKLISDIEELNNNNSQNKRYKNTIPNLLNNIMAIIPKNVQLTSIENTSGTHIKIVARSSKYEPFAFFRTKLKSEEILSNIVSDTGTMKDGYITVTIEGELP